MPNPTASARSVPLLSQQSEARLSAALSQVADRVGTGEDPSQAIVKVASEAGFNRGFAELMVRAYNTGRTLAHIEHAADPFEKAADVQLADRDVVLEQLYPHLKTAAEASREEISREYAAPPEQFLRREFLAKVAVDLRPTGPLPEPLPRDTTREWDRCFHRLQDARRDLGIKQAEAAGVVYQTVAQLTALREYFEKDGSIPFIEVRENCQAVWGRRAEGIFREVSCHQPAFAKRAAARRPTPVRWDAAPYSVTVPSTASGRVG